MVETTAKVIQFSERYRDKPPSSASYSEGTYLIDFKSCGGEILALRKWRGYANQYLEQFLALEDECVKLSNCFARFGVCGRSGAAQSAARDFVATGALVQKSAKKLKGRVPSVSNQAQQIARRLGKAIQGLTMQRKGVKKNLYAELTHITGQCYLLRDVLYPLRKEAKASQPAHA